MFTLTKEQCEKINEWVKTHKETYTGAIGGRYTYTFHPTTLGVVVKVIDELTKEELDVTDYESW